MLKDILVIYFILVNIIAVIITTMDKIKAIKRDYRISERRLFIVAIFGGAVSMYAVMRLIRHKIRHRRFMIGLPILIFFQLCIFVFIELA